MSNVPKEFVSVIQAFVVVFVAAPKMVEAIVSPAWLKKFLAKKKSSAAEKGGKA